jgi:hypothetical protein
VGEQQSRQNGQTWKKFVVVVDRDEPDVADFHSLIGKAPTKPIPILEDVGDGDPFRDEDAGSLPYAQHVMKGRRSDNEEPDEGCDASGSSRENRGALP